MEILNKTYRESRDSRGRGCRLVVIKLATFNSCCGGVTLSVSVYLKISPDTGAHLAKTIRNERERDEQSETGRAPTIQWTMEPLINTSFSRFSDLLLEAEINFLQHVALFAEGCFCPRHVGPLIPNAKHTKYIQYNNQTISSLFRILAYK